ncbi:MAG: hypothetical protein ACHP7E_00075 [Burkholderiales bacterium]
MLTHANSLSLENVEIGYRLKALPALTDKHRSAGVMRALAQMETGALGLRALVDRSGLAMPVCVELLVALNAQGCLLQTRVPPTAGSGRHTLFATAPRRDALARAAEALMGHVRPLIIKVKATMGRDQAWADTALPACDGGCEDFAFAHAPDASFSVNR